MCYSHKKFKTSIKGSLSLIKRHTKIIHQNEHRAKKKSKERLFQVDEQFRLRKKYGKYKKT